MVTETAKNERENSGLEENTNGEKNQKIEDLEEKLLETQNKAFKEHKNLNLEIKNL